MNDNIIFHKLNNHLKKVQQIYPIERIFGIFVTEIIDNDILSEAVIIPSFEEICTGYVPVTGVLDGGITILDIRTAYRATAAGHPELIKSLYTDYVIVNPLYQHIFQKVYKNNREVFKAGIASGAPSPELKVALTKVCRLAWNETSNAVRFIKQLTDVEKLALEEITRLIGDEGIVSQSKAASACGVSRLTMSNLVMKMKTYGVAKIEYLGNRGTYIKFIDDVLLDPRGVLQP